MQKLFIRSSRLTLQTGEGFASSVCPSQQNFGPISRQGGWRRLNVLFTRARQELKLFTSLDPEDIAIGPDSPQGTVALRNYLQFVKTGHDTTPENSGALPDSDFEYFVIRRLQAIGYSVVPQLGVGKYRIDIAVVHPDIAGAYLAAIECDGESYHSAESARDRDRIRQEVLEWLGWRGRIWRIWSTDWFRDAEAEFTRLADVLKLTHIASYWPNIATPTPRTDPRDRPMARPSDARLLCIL